MATLAIINISTASIANMRSFIGRECKVSKSLRRSHVRGDNDVMVAMSDSSESAHRFE